MHFSLAVDKIVLIKQLLAEKKVLRVGTNADFAPFEISKTKMVATEYQGFDMDLIRAVAKEMGYTAEIQNVNFDGLIPAMESGNIDIIVSGMTINEERKKSGRIL